MLPRENKNTFGNIAKFLKGAELAKVKNTNKNLSNLVETTPPGKLMEEAKNLNHSLGFRVTLAKYTPDINKWYQRKQREWGLGDIQDLKDGTYIGSAIGPISGMLCSQLLEKNLLSLYSNVLLTTISSVGAYLLLAKAKNYDGAGLMTAMPVGATLGFLTAITAYISDSPTAPIAPLVVAGFLAVNFFNNKSYVVGVQEQIQEIHHALKK